MPEKVLVVVFTDQYVRHGAQLSEGAVYVEVPGLYEAGHQSYEAQSSATHTLHAAAV